jgi:hypothetical protein
LPAPKRLSSAAPWSEVEWSGVQWTAGGSLVSELGPWGSFNNAGMQSIRVIRIIPIEVESRKSAYLGHFHHPSWVHLHAWGLRTSAGVCKYIYIYIYIYIYVCVRA